jgi:UDP-N-acetylmuramoylalanine--D-glutamate ligase
MRAAEIGGLRVAIWGLGREGRAVIALLRQYHPKLPLLALDDAADATAPGAMGGEIKCVFGAEPVARALGGVDLIVKSPGVSLYRPEIESARAAGTRVTSLLNFWFAERPDLTTICVTGTKGKSTTASLIAHILAELGRRAVLVGNIGVPITGIDTAKVDIAVIEVSSYQAADFDGICDIAVLTSLYPEHIDWHLSVDNYYRDKINLLNHARHRIVNRAAAKTVERFATGGPAPQDFFNEECGVHCRGTEIWDGARPIGEVRNPHLTRPHNRSNLCAALTATKSLEIDPAAALEAVTGFRGLPHRQQELGEIGGVLFVDDSISTIPESTVAALAVYAGREITLILGGHDRGIDYDALVKKAVGGAAKAIIGLGNSGERIYSLAQKLTCGRNGGRCKIYHARSMGDAVAYARQVTPPGGVVLLSPAAPSYDHYRDYIERGRDFAAQAGLPASAEPSYSRVEYLSSTTGGNA